MAGIDTGQNGDILSPRRGDGLLTKILDLLCSGICYYIHGAPLTPFCCLSLTFYNSLSVGKAELLFLCPQAQRAQAVQGRLLASAKADAVCGFGRASFCPRRRKRGILASAKARRSCRLWALISRKGNIRSWDHGDRWPPIPWGSERPENEPVCSFSAENGRQPRGAESDRRAHGRQHWALREGRGRRTRLNVPPFREAKGGSREALSLRRRSVRERGKR